MTATTQRRRNYDAMPRNLSGIQYFYMSLVSWGILLTVKDGELLISSPTGNVPPALRKAIEARKVALVKHVMGLGGVK